MAVVEQRLTEADFDRAERLVKQFTISRAEYDTAVAARDKARPKVVAAQAALDMVLSGSRHEEVAEARALLDGVQARHEQLRRGTRPEDVAAARAAVALAQAQLAEAEATLHETVVTAPARCLVAEVTVRPGSVVAAGQAVIVAH
jgi:multidrug resistance efflux pump